ncbi:MAG: hypothetical protein DRI22_02065 [Caldiserica bacterium]|nr:MAG: hypothetical protein DRI22_02065 [Caldisericota bacterium]
MEKRSRVEKFLLFYISLDNFALGLTLSIGMLYFLSRGVSLSWIGYLASISALTILIFEFPTGVVADKFGCGLSVFISNILLFLSFLIAYFSYGNFMFLIVSIISAIGMTFSTGALSGWFIQKEPSVKKRLALIYSEINILSNIFKLVGGILGAIIFSFLKPLPFLLSSLLYGFLSISFLFFNRFKLINISNNSQKNPIRELIEHSKESILFSYREKRILYIFLVTFFFIIAATGPFIYWQPFFKNQFKSTFPVGIVFAVYSLSAILGSSVLRANIPKIKRYGLAFSISILFGGIMIFLTGFTKIALLSLIFFSIYHFSLGIGNPIRMKLLNEVIPDEKRASILSFLSLIEGGGEGLSGFMWGGLSRAFPLNIIFSLVSIPILLSFILSLKLKD